MNIHKSVIQFLKKNPGTYFKFNHLLGNLHLAYSEKAVLHQVLNELVLSEKISKDGKYFFVKAQADEFFTGELVITKNNTLAVKFKDVTGKTSFLDVKLKKGQKISVGDKVEFRKSFKGKTKSEYARVLRIINKDVYYITGFFDPKRNHAKVNPDTKKIRQDVIVKKEDYNGAVYGDKVVCEIINFKDIEDGLIDLDGRIIEVLGKAGDTNVEIKSVMKKYGLTDKFEDNVIDESVRIFEDYKKGFSPEEQRRDLRDIDVFTIDPEDAKDFDDAVSIKKQTDGWQLGVHIADVSHYVRDDSEIDIEAFRRATSVYFPGKVIPMLPEILSNDLCSLKPDTDRLAFSIFIDLNKNCEVKKFELTKSIIRSKRRFTYEEVEEIIKSKKGDFANDILTMYKISKSLTSKRIDEGSIDFDSREIKFELNKKGLIKSIGIKVRLDSMRLIEEFMLLANKCVTEYVNNLSKKMGQFLPFVYRVHDLPDIEKLQNLSEFIRQFGYKTNLTDKKEIKKLLEEIKGRPEEYIINDLLIRSMAKAIYTNENIGHYGLGFKNYTHFTSPIRRYPDMIVHRLLFAYINMELSQSKLRLHPRYMKGLDELCKHCSVQEQNAIASEREVTKILQIEFIKDKVGDEFDAIISGIGRFGFFVQLSEYLIEGMVRYRDIPGDYYEFDEKNHCARGVRKGKIFHAGNRLRVRLINADQETRKIDFEIV